MSHVILRRTKDASVSAAEAISFVTGTRTQGRVLSHSGNNVLVDVAPTQVSEIAERLPGWIVSEQRATVPHPDARLRPRSR